MSTESFLVALDGSKDALKASEVAWKLAKSRGAKVTALTVVDTQSIWDVLGRGLSGLIGSGPYVAAFENLQASLRAIGEALLVSFESRSEGYGIETATVLEEGSLADRVLHHSKNHDLLIMGRRPTVADKDKSVIRTSLSEKLAAATPNPVIIVASEPKLWKRARLILDSATFDRKTISAFLRTAKDLELAPEIFCTDGHASWEGFTNALKDIVPATVSVLFHDPEYGDEAWQEAIDVTSATLLFIATSQREGKRAMSNGPFMRDLVSSGSVTSVVVLPPSSPETGTERIEKPAATARR